MSGWYDDLIMDHIKNARNYRVPHEVDCTATGTNPLCGDEITVYVALDGELIADVAFQCTCCGISMASASIMTELVNGSRVDEAKALLRDVVTMLTSVGQSPSDPGNTGRLAILETVKKFPARTRCAALPWATLEAALQRQETAFVR